MNILVVGAGGVGEAIAAISKGREFVKRMVLCDVNAGRAQSVARRMDDDRFVGIGLDASDKDAIVAAAGRFDVQAIVNACDPRFNEAIFDAAFEARVTYLDMAMTLSKPHPDKPYEETGVPLGKYQFDRSSQWEGADLLAVAGIGVEPGLSDVLARYASDHLFTRIDEVGVRDGADLVVEGYDFAPTFSIWTTIEECLNPPVVYERDRGWFTTPPFSEPEVFTFPEGIGDLECVNVEHEEVVLIPRWLDVGRVTFKYGLGEEFIDVLKTIHKLGLDSTETITVGRSQVSPRDVVAAVLPNPASIGDLMSGRTCAGSWVKGTGMDGDARETYLYHVVDNAECMARYGCQAVVAQTALNPVIALELIESGTWSGAGVLGPEAFSANPFLELLDDYGHPHAVEDRTPS
jgi:saccharopine dehydrogenase-like NADP-dependent oxidoreductase